MIQSLRLPALIGSSVRSTLGTQPVVRSPFSKVTTMPFGDLLGVHTQAMFSLVRAMI